MATLNKPLHWILALLAGLLILFCVSLVVAMNYFNSPLPEFSAGVEFEIKEGSSFNSLNGELERLGIIENPLLFSVLARFQGVTNSIQTGEYQITEFMTPSDLLSVIVLGNEKQYRLTLVEGWTFSQALDAIQRSDRVSVILNGLSHSDIAKRLGLQNENPEGLLFPETYFYTANTTDLDLLIRANNKLNEVLESEWSARLGALPYEDSYQALTMASIIEKESSASSERGHIAGVFIRRLERGMRLQSDPTVIYGMGESYDGDIRRRDLQEVTPYNTYRINGLPPTPIALAGLDSISAALNPLESDYLYFVSQGDGTHYFSSTLEEHNSAVQRYLLQTAETDE